MMGRRVGAVPYPAVQQLRHHPPRSLHGSALTSTSASLRRHVPHTTAGGEGDGAAPYLQVRHRDAE